LFSTIALTALAPSPQDPPPPALLIEAATIQVSPDVQVSGASLLVRGRRVAAVGAEVPADLGTDVRRVAFAGATVVPGLVLAHGHAGAEADLAETIDASTPELRATDAFDPFGKELSRLLRGGVTTLGLAPRSANTLAGLAGAVKTGPREGSLLHEVCYLKAALVSESLDQQRFPT
jgi:imidazolonepropionase-like amidohydrolase